MAIKIDGSSGTDIISAADGSLTIEGVVSTDKLVAKTEDWITHTGDTNTRMGFPATDVFAVETAGTERFRIHSDGRFWINTQTGSSATELLRVENTGSSSTDSRVSIISGSAAQAVLLFGDDQSYNQGQIVYSNNDHSMRFHANAGQERLRIDSSGKVSISSDGTIDGILTIKADTDQINVPSIRLLDGSDTREVSISNTSGDFVVSVHGNDNAIHGHIKMFESGILDINNGGASGSNLHRLRIDSSGNVLIGDSAGQIGKLSTLGTGNHISAIRHSSDLSAANFIFAKYRGTRASPTTVIDNDHLGNLTWYGYNGSAIIKAADITAECGGTVDGSNMPTDLVFSTTTGNTNSERLRIYNTNSTNTGIAKFTSPSSGDMLNLQNSSGGGQGLIFGVDTSASPGYTYIKNNTSGTYDLAFILAGSEKLRIFAGGGIHVKSASVATGTLDGGTDDVIIENSTSAGIAFKVPNSERSTITFATTGTGGQNEAWIQYAHESVSTTADRRCMMFRVGGTERARISGDGKFSLSGDNDTYLERTDANQWRMHVNGNYSMEWSANKRIRTPQVWSTNGSSMRDVQVESDGTLCAGNTSIRAAKKNIVSQTDVSWLYDLNPVTFNYRKHTVHPTTGVNTYLDEVEEETSYGLIAEEVEAVKKDFCFYNDDELSGVAYRALITPLLKALQDQKKEIDALKTKVAALESA